MEVTDGCVRLTAEDPVALLSAIRSRLSARAWPREAGRWHDPDPRFGACHILLTVASSTFHDSQKNTSCEKTSVAHQPSLTSGMCTVNW